MDTDKFKKAMQLDDSITELEKLIKSMNKYKALNLSTDTHDLMITEENNYGLYHALKNDIRYELSRLQKEFKML